MIKYLFKLLLLFQFSTSYSQKEANIWCFGNKAGIDFNNPCNPIALTDGLNDGGFEGTSTICDPNTGQLLFYVDGYWVWNKNHAKMTNGYLNSNSPSQTLILKKPGSNTLFYVITPELQGNVFLNNYGLRYAEVDMALNGGLGDVTNSNGGYLLTSPVTEKLTATRHANGTDIWIVCHTHNDNNFKAFLLSSTGISTTPIVSSIGSIHTSNFSGWGAIGEMKMSPNGQKIALAVYEMHVIELFDFNNTTGQVTNPLSLNSEIFPYGISFSPDNTKLYVTSEAFNRTIMTPIISYSKLCQFDVSSNNQSTINASKSVIYTAGPSGQFPTDFLGSLKIAPNNKIYVGRGTNKDSLAVINNPNISGTNCNYVHNGFFLNGGKVNIGLNNAMEIDYETCQLSILDNSMNSVVLYPSPLIKGAVLKIAADNLGDFKSFSLINLFGSIIFKEDININGQISIDTQNLISGIYLYEITNKENEVITVGRLVVP